MDRNRLLKAQEVADLLGISLKALRELVGARAIPFVRLSPRRLRFKASDVEAFIERHRIDCQWR